MLTALTILLIRQYRLAKSREEFFKWLMQKINTYTYKAIRIGMAVGLTISSFFAYTQNANPCNTGVNSGASGFEICPPNGTTLVSSFTKAELYLSGKDCTDGLCPGSVWRFADIASGRVINATVTIDAIVNAKLKKLDDDTSVDQFGNSAESLFTPTITSDINLNGTDRKGYVEFTIRFFREAVGDGYLSTTNLTNLKVLNYDIDGSNAGNINISTAGSWYRESIYLKELSAENPSLNWAPATFLSADSSTDQNNQWKGSLSSLCQSSGVSQYSQLAMAAQFSKPQSTLTFRIGYDYNAGGNIGMPLSQFGIKLSCFDFLIGTPMPVNLYEFVAKRTGQTVQLEWATTYEQYNQGFRIQRKSANEDYTDVGFLPSSAQDGNSQVKLYYNFTDSNNIKGISQYRIMQTDIMRQTRVSEVRSVSGLEQKINLVVYPNPANDGKVNIVFENSKSGREIVVYNFMGQAVKLWVRATGNTITAENLLPGIYTVKILDHETGNTGMKKFIVAQ